MGRIKWKYISLILLVVLIIIVVIRITTVNKNQHYYEAYRVNVQAGETITLGDLEFTFGQASPPLIEESEDYPNEKIAVYKLPIKVTKQSDRPLEKKNKFGIYEKYKDYNNLALVDVDYTDKQKQDLFSTLSALKKEETVSLTISTDFILSDFYYYYDDYNVDKPAYIVIAGPQSPKGIPLYYYKIQQKS